ncbi:MAG TPA: FxLYD domain-containing protein [Nitrososphaeraceae archaeon]|nr:FxLYD domain-containing protein [Nitrososphaeraceae archaeon]
MHLVIIVMVLLFLWAMFGSSDSLAPVPAHATRTTTLTASNDTVIQFTSSFIDESSIMHVYGEIKNISNSSLTSVIVKGSFYDDEGKLLNKYQRSCELPTVGSGGACPFEILYIDTKTTNNVKDIKLSALGIHTDKIKPTTLKVYSDNAKLNIPGFYYINGRISNEGSVTATDSSVVATLYDKDGNVIALERALAEPANIPSGTQASFGIAVTEKSQVHKTKSYSLVAYSDQYLSPSISVVYK